MKKEYLYPIVQAILIAIPLTALYALTYTESSSGLVPPSFEAGRTEIEISDLNIDLPSPGLLNAISQI